VGEWLTMLPAADPDAVAYHFRQAGDARSIDWLIKAGERAQRTFASVTAQARYQTALTLMEQLGIHAGERGWLLFRLARLYVLRESHVGITYLEEADDHMLAAYSLFTLGDIRYLSGDIDRGLAEMRAGVAAHDTLATDARPRHRPPDIFGALDRGYARRELLEYLANSGRYAEAQACATEMLAEPLPPASPPWGALGHGYGGYALMHAAMGRPDEARRAFGLERAARRARAGDYNVGLSALNELRFVALTYQTDDRAGRERLAAEAEQEYARAQAFGLPPERGRLPLMVVEAQWAQAVVVAQAVLAVGGNGAYMGNARCALAPLARAQGDVRLAWHIIEEALPKGPTTAPGGVPLYLDSLILQRLAAALAIDAGDLPLADAWLTAHDAWRAWSGAVLGRSEGALQWARYHRASGDIATAYDSAARALQHATEPRQPLALLAAHRLLGKLATGTGQYDKASVHLDTALIFAEACAAPYERALTLFALTELHAASGDTAAATALVDEVRAICTPLGAKPVLARTDALAARLAATRTTAPAYPSGLSAREVEVLRLVAAGQTNRDIADALFLSEHTVRVHVRNILTKTNTDNRAAATAFALRHGIA
jgi:DNA-binding CsgD family transcriptional regulator